MDISRIISISGKPGIFKILGQAKNSVIVESLVDGKKFPAYSKHKISALSDISIYTYEEDVPLKEVYEKFAEKFDYGTGPDHKSEAKVLRAKLEEILPGHDEDRVYDTDIKKLFQWYNILHGKGYVVKEDPKEEEAKDEKKTAKKAPAKKAAPKKSPAKNAPSKKSNSPKPMAKKTGAPIATPKKGK